MILQIMLALIALVLLAILITRPNVYLLEENKYRYMEAADACRRRYRRGRLATLDEIRNAYDKGADWCNAGWTQEMLGAYASRIERPAHGCKAGVHAKKLPGQTKLGAYCLTWGT
jgi:hypothetical protein